VIWIGGARHKTQREQSPSNLPVSSRNELDVARFESAAAIRREPYRRRWK
jgi:hypothetical protein